jgi:hypothetical protein
MSTNTQSNKAGRLTGLGRPSRSISRISSYVASAASAGILATPAVEAAVISIDLGPSGFNILGPNAGIVGNGTKVANPFPAAGLIGSLSVVSFPGDKGLFPNSGLEIANGGAYSTPTKLSGGDVIDPSLTFNSLLGHSSFRYGSDVSPDFGPGSYIGFRSYTGTSSSYRYGYLEVTWTSASNTFEILSGAYESVPDTPITVPVPEPSGLAGVASMAIGALAVREHRRRKRAAVTAPIA